MTDIDRRAQIIANFTMLAAYFADPTTPLPTDLHVYVHHQTEDQMLRHAAAIGAKILFNAGTVHCRVPLSVEALHGIRTDMVLFAEGHPKEMPVAYSAHNVMISALEKREQDA